MFTSSSSLNTRPNQTICEVNGGLVDESGLAGGCVDNQIVSYPQVHVTLESLRRSAVTSESAQSAFLEHSETLMQRVQAAWYGHGLIGALTEISDCETTEEVSPYVKKACRYLVMTLRWLSGMQLTLFPHLKLSNDQLISTFSENSDWLESPIRFLAWHSRADKFAIALKDDTVRIYYSDNDLVPMLKHKLQRNVTVVSWKPLSASTLAVGTQTAILIWNIDPCSLSTRPSAGAVQVLSYTGHNPVTSLAWCPHGRDLLFTASALSSAIVVWDVCLKQHQVIQHVSTCGGVSRLSFSPDGSKVMASTPSASFRVFETATWTNERWSKLAGRVQTSCWNPDGTILLFSLVSDPRIYALTFADSRSFDLPQVDGSKHASVIVDLTPEIDDSDPTPEPRNSIHTLIMDESGKRLAVMFDKEDHRHDVVALYAVTTDPVFTVSLCGFIHGDDSDPVFIAFKPNFNDGAVLTICYSNGQVKYIPMYFQRALQQYNQTKIASPGKSFSSRPMLDASQSIWSTSQNSGSVLS